jgi:murein DD-endopeptidase MepM/ murein hydrolase activator NlpD
MFKKFISDRQNVMCAGAILLAVVISAVVIQTRPHGDLGSYKGNSTALSGQVPLSLEPEDINISERNFETDDDLLTSASDKGEPENKEIKIHTYTVESGDTLSSIASAHNLKVSTIAESNKLSLGSILNVGQVLVFPSIDGILHEIRSGETIWDISVLNNVEVDRIAEVNNLDAPDKLQLGQKLIIPDVDKLRFAVASTSTPVVSARSTISRGGSGSSGVSGGSSISFSMPARGRITSPFGMRWGRMHNGIDIAAPTGTPIYASAAGQVTFSGWNGGYGNLVIINHGNGMETYYAHNSKNLVSKGQNVSKGAHIANMGSTGNSTGPHVHFEIRRNGTPLNPMNFLR